MRVKVALASVPIFQFVPQEQLKALTQIAKTIDKAKGEAVLLLQEPVLGIYLVASGSVGVYPHAIQKPLITLQPGESFGEMSFLERMRASATIRAESDATKLALFPQAELDLLVENEPLLGRALYRGIALSLSQKLRATTGRIASELATSRAILTGLASSGDGTHEIASMPAAVRNLGLGLEQRLDQCQKSIEELARRIPEKAGSIQELMLVLGETRSKSKPVMAALFEHAQLLARFAGSFEESTTL